MSRYFHVVELEVLQRVWPVLAFLAYVLAAACLTVLAAYRKKHCALHDRVRESKLLRIKFQQGQTEEFEVDIAED